MKTFYTELSIFRKRTGMQYSCGNVVASSFKELGELVIEIDKNDELKIIDELCDLVIFPVNALEAMGHDAKTHIEKHNDLWLCSPKTAAMLTGTGLVKYMKSKDIKELSLIAAWSMQAIRSMGFSPDDCVLEKAMCINSREGEYNESEEKWCKNPNQDPATLYKPRYDFCRYPCSCKKGSPDCDNCQNK